MTPDDIARSISWHPLDKVNDRECKNLGPVFKFCFGHAFFAFLFSLFAFLSDKVADRPDLVADLGRRETRVCPEKDRRVHEEKVESGKLKEEILRAVLFRVFPDGGKDGENFAGFLKKG